MVIAAVDYGDARTGLAVCDKMEILATPAGVIKETWQPNVVKKIDEFVKKVSAEAIVVGYPINMDGSAGFRAQKCEELAQKLKEECGLPVYLWDERCTTVSAHEALNLTNTRGAKRKQAIDQVSAVFILQGFLDSRKCSR